MILIYFLEFVFNLLQKFQIMKMKFQKLKQMMLFLDVKNVIVILIINIKLLIIKKIKKLSFVIFVIMKMILI